MVFCCNVMLAVLRNGGMMAASPSTTPICVGARMASNWAATMATKVRVAFALDCCDREAIGFVATTEGIKGEDVRDLMEGTTGAVSAGRTFTANIAQAGGAGHLAARPRVAPYTVLGALSPQVLG